MTSYACSIGTFERLIEASSPQEAARKCAAARMQSRAWFANESPMAVAVLVDGVEYVPESHASGQTLTY
jgi:hypothetical protein